MRLLYGQDAAVAGWVKARIEQMPAEGFGPCAAVGVISGEGQPLAGVVFHAYQPEFGTMQLSMAADSPRWAHRAIVAQLLAYPFIQVGVNKIYTLTPHKNVRAIKFNKGIGFTQEAVLKDQFGKGNHAVICRLMAKDYHRLFVENQHG